MVEVFKTNVKDATMASLLIEQIHATFNSYKANFDLEDCDHILRVKSTTGQVQATTLIDLLRNYGYRAEVLPE